MTTEQKESTSKSAESFGRPKNSRRYDLYFADGKRSTALDMTDSDPDQMIKSLAAIFHDGYVLKITHG